MEESRWEVVILKPTSAFLSFLAKQCPAVDLPELPLLQADSTAYMLHRHDSEEEMLDEIERHFSRMFKHEIGRCLGEKAQNKIKGSFLDFLCCFKFELHSQIILMEPEIADGHQLLCIKPRSVTLKWTKPSARVQDELINTLEHVNVSHMVENATVVVKNFKQLSEVKSFIKKHYRPLFKAEMSRISGKTNNNWLAVDTLQEFNRYFAVEVHTQLVHFH